MSVHRLEALFEPRSVAVIGASIRPQRVGTVLFRNLARGGFEGPVWPVNPKYTEVEGRPAFRSASDLPEAPDLAVICTPPASVPGIVAELAASGTRAAVVLTAGLGAATDERGRTLESAMLEAARPHGLRLLGPNCVGLIAPHARLNATFLDGDAPPGSVAFVSQSGALCTVALDWARAKGVGFSAFVSLGDAADVDFGDLIDFLGSDPRTRSILLYLESIRGARKFLSAARAAARNKPIVAIKAGRVAEGERAAASHTGALAGSDEVFDYALRRAGVLRVDDVDELFDAAETLVRASPLPGDRLAILTNGGGPGVLATDRLVAGGGRLAELAPRTLRALDEVLPKTWSRGNPIDLIGDATGDRYRAALRALADDPGIDALLVLHAPTALVAGEEAASAVIEASRGARWKLLTCWLGREAGTVARHMFADAGVATFDTPGDAVRAFLRLAAHRKGLELQRQTPPASPEGFEPDRGCARIVVEDALAEGREWLSEPEAKQVLAAYGLEVVRTRVARDEDEAAALAEELGFPVALKLLSPDVLHKSDVGGVALDLESTDALRRAAAAMRARLEAWKRGARVEGFTVQDMARRPRARELIVGAAVDPIFGPFVLFGEGGTAVEVVADRAVALPPLDLVLARDLVQRTRVWRLLRGYRDRPPADLDALCRCLVRVGQLLIDLPWVAELDANPVLADDEGVVVLDARMRVTPRDEDGEARLAIRPYPRELEESIALRSGRRVLLRPIRPEDEPAHRRLLERARPEDVRFRFFHRVRRLPHSELARHTQIDYDREMAFVAVDPASGESLGVARAVADPDHETAEFAILVASDAEGQGLGRALLEKLVRYCRARGTRELVGRVAPEAARVRELARSLGFEERATEDPSELGLRLELR